MREAVREIDAAHTSRERRVGGEGPRGGAVDLRERAVLAPHEHVRRGARAVVHRRVLGHLRREADSRYRGREDARRGHRRHAARDLRRDLVAVRAHADRAARRGEAVIAADGDEVRARRIDDRHGELLGRPEADPARAPQEAGPLDLGARRGERPRVVVAERRRTARARADEDHPERRAVAVDRTGARRAGPPGAEALEARALGCLEDDRAAERALHASLLRERVRAIDVVGHEADGDGGAARHAGRRVGRARDLAERDVREHVDGRACLGDREERERGGDVVGGAYRDIAEGVGIARGGERILREAIRRRALEGGVRAGPVDLLAGAVHGAELEGAHLDRAAEERELVDARLRGLERDRLRLLGDRGALRDGRPVRDHAHAFHLRRVPERCVAGLRGASLHDVERGAVGDLRELLAIGDAVRVLVVSVDDDHDPIAGGARGRDAGDGARREQRRGGDERSGDGLREGHGAALSGARRAAPRCSRSTRGRT